MDIESRETPEEIIAEEILARLSAKSLLRFRSVSKAWCCLIGSERFIERHLKFSAKYKERGSFICGSVVLKRQYSVESFLKIRRRSQMPVVDPMWTVGVVDGLVTIRPPHTVIHPLSFINVVGCCNGLVCLGVTHPDRYFLWNPSTRISKELPIGSIDFKRKKASGFGWDKSSGAYKLCVCKINDPGFEVYSSKTNSWKTVDRTIDFQGKGKFVSGKVYWHWNRGIVTFDMKSEEFGFMQLPPGCLKDHHLNRLLVGEFEGSLCVAAVRERLNVWVMKCNFWFHMVADVPLHLDRYEYPWLRFPDSFIAAPNGQIWLCYDKCYLAYDYKHNLVLPLKHIGGFMNPHLCLESLVRP